MIDLSKVHVLLSQEQIQQRCSELGAQISKDYEGEELVLICLLKGGIMFMTDLSKYITAPVTMDFMRVSSYGNSTNSSGEVKIKQDLEYSVEGKNILIAEDIVDSGWTLHNIRPLLEKRGAKSVRVCALLNKPERREVEVPIEYVGFEIENHFMLGYGLDYEQYYRNLPYIGYINLDENPIL